MHPHLCSHVLEVIERHRTWRQSFLFNTCHGVVDLSKGVGRSITPLLHLPYQPEEYPHGTSYRFNPQKYLGRASSSKILTDVVKSLPGSSMYRKGKKFNSYDPDDDNPRFSTWRLQCSFGDVAQSAALSNFAIGSFSKIGTIQQPIKRRHDSNKVVTARMPNAKLKRDKRNRNDEDTSATKEPPAKKRNLSKRALSSCSKCKLNVYLRCYHTTGHWYLAKSSSLQHENHLPLPPEFSAVRSSDVDPIETDFMQLLFEQGCSFDALHRVANILRRSNGKIGDLKKQTIKNLIRKSQLKLEMVQGISRKWSYAQKTMRQLEEMGVSYCALIMDKNDDLIVVRGKGRPSKKDQEIIKTHGDLRVELQRVRRNLKLTHGDILLSLSVASDEMIRAMQMYPEVQFMDCAANLNGQRRDVFFSVIKDSAGQCFIVNITVLPCQQRWIFLKIYQTFFLSLYGEDTIDRIRLVLTDDDVAEHGPLDDVQILVDCWTRNPSAG